MGADPRNDLDALVDRNLWFSHADRRLRPAHPGHWCPAVAGCQRSRAIAWRDPGRFGLLFLAIEYMQNGMAGVSWNLNGLSGPGSMWLLAGIGAVMTIVMQSSTAARRDDPRGSERRFALVRARLRDDSWTERGNDRDDRR